MSFIKQKKGKDITVLWLSFWKYRVFSSYFEVNLTTTSYFILYCPLCQELRQILFEKVHVTDFDSIGLENGALINF